MTGWEAAQRLGALPEQVPKKNVGSGQERYLVPCLRVAQWQKR